MTTPIFKFAIKQIFLLLMTEILYADISGDNEPCVLDSLCINCEKQGKTTILLTKIPMFSEIIIVSFDCQECGYRNNEVQFGGKLKDQGVKYELLVKDGKDLSRSIVRSEHCKITIPELDFELPANKKGCINTLEGYLSNIIIDLSTDQPIRKYSNPEVYEKIEELLEKLKAYKDGDNLPFHWVMQDPSGNSFIQNPVHPLADDGIKLEQYHRTKEEIEHMGYSVENQKQDLQDTVQAGKEEIQVQGQDLQKGLDENVKGESLVFPTPCNACGEMGENKMCTVSIPHFKNILIMSFKCDHCGNKDTEVKSQGEISAQGRLIKLHALTENDLKRDVFFSETASLEIPEVELELKTGTLGGVYSNVEGVLEKILNHLRDNNPFVGDSATHEFKGKMEALFLRLEAFKEGKEAFTLIIRDLVENSFIQNINYPNEDQNVWISSFARTADDNDWLGIDTMKTENYQEQEN